MGPADLKTREPKRYTDGTHRVTPPAETVSRVSRQMAALGITRVANITGLDRIGIPVVVVIRPNSRSLSVSQGKGPDIHAAKASALMESIESYHAESIDLPLKLGSYEELRRRINLVETERLPRSRQDAFSEHRTLLWIEAYDLMNDEYLWIPYEMAHTRFTLPRPTGSGCFYSSSNGLASGNHRFEALSHAICELVERDSSTFWYLLSDEERDRTRVDPQSVDDPGCRKLLEMCDRAEIEAIVWESTSDIGVPCFVCQIAERNAVGSLYSTSGFGCHPDRAIALSRAITEAAQGRLTLISGSRDDVFRDDYNSSLNPMSIARHRGQIEVKVPMRSYRDAPSFASETFNDDLDWLLARLRDAGLTRVLAVDLTKPEFQLPVVKVVIPGLESLITDPNYHPGYRAKARRPGGDVPVVVAGGIPVEAR